jgi:hypothetical protein
MTQVTTNWWDKCVLRTYDDFNAHFNTARNKEKGKPLKSWARIYKTGDTLEFCFGDRNGLKFGELTPDNIFTFIATPHAARNTAAVTFSSSLYKAVPFMWQRTGMARYRVSHTSAIPEDTERGYMVWTYMRQDAPEYFEGMQFNMLTGECINKRADFNAVVNTANRKIWLSSLRKFKYGIKARARIGSFEKLIEAQKVLPRNNQSCPDWSNSDWQELLHNSIKNTEFPMELINGFVAHAVHDRWYYHRGNVKAADILTTVDEVCNTYSVELRRKFGVFDAVSEMRKENEVP